MDQVTELLLEQNRLLTEILEALRAKKKPKKTLECLFDFETVYKIYPRKEGKTVGFARLATSIKTSEEFELLVLAAKRYKEKVEREKTEKKFVMMFSTFAGRWRDYLPVQELSIAKANVTSETSLLI